MATATVSYRAELSDLRKQLAGVTDITRAEAKKMVTELNRSMRAVEKAQNKASSSARGYSGAVQGAARSSSQLSQAAGSVAMQLPDVASQLAAGTPPAQVFAQQGLQVVQMNMTSLLRVMARFGPHAAAVGGAVALLGGAYVLLARQVEQAEEAMEAAANAATAAQQRHQDFAGTIDEITLALAKATGEYDELAVAQQERDQALRRGAQAQRDAAKAVRDAAVAEHVAARAQRDRAHTVPAISAANKRLEKSERDLFAANKLYARQLEGINAREAEGLRQSGEIVTATNRQRDAVQRLKDETRAKAEADRAAAEAERERLALQREQEAATARLQAISRDAAMSTLGGTDRIIEGYLRQIETIGQLEEVSRNRAEAEQARALTASAYQQELTEYRDRLERDLLNRQVMREQQLQRARQQTVNNYMAAAQIMAQSLASSFAEGSAAAKTFFVVSQGVAAAQAVIQSRAAAMAALAPPPLGLGPVAGAPLATSTRVLGTVQAAAIMAQTVSGFADTPGVQRAGSAGMAATFAPGDLVVAGRDEGDLVRQMQRAGIGMGGTEVMVRDADRHHGRYGRNPMRAPDRYGLVRRRAGRVPGRR